MFSAGARVFFPEPEFFLPEPEPEVKNPEFAQLYLPENFEKIEPFPAFWSGFLCMKQVTNEKKILRLLAKQT